MKQVWVLALKEMRLEFRERHAMAAILLFILSAVFVCYLGFRTLSHTNTWNALFWIIVLFSSFNALGGSFRKEERGLLLYLYTLARPERIIMGKQLYNALLTAAMTGLTLPIFAMFMGRGILADARMDVLAAAALGGALGLSAILTMVSGIAAKTGNAFGMIAVLGFPVIIPVLTAALRASKNALDGLPWEVSQKYILVLAGLWLLVLALSYLLFPYLWRE